MNPNTRTNARRNSGFSLMELLVAIAIIGILAAIAIPSYRDHVRRGQIEEATAVLSQGRITFEQWFLDNRNYTGADAAGAACPASTSHFTVACVSDATTYTLSATGPDAATDFIYTLNERNQRSTTSIWGNGACWITQKGGSC